MTELLNKLLPRTLDRVVAEAGKGPLEVWCFDDRASRRSVEAVLAARGISARIRSAYKPLLHAFLEDIPLEGLTQVRITYPVHPEADPNRFRLETYPLVAILSGVELTLVPGGADLHYDVELLYGTERNSLRVFAPNRLHTAVTGLPTLSPTGWRRSEYFDERVETDYEGIFDAVMNTLTSHNWIGAGPYFEQLFIEVTLPAKDEPLPYRHEVISLGEALHEDLYFSSLELFQHVSGRPAGDRGLQPGQIIPWIQHGTLPHVRVSLRSYATPKPALSNAFIPLEAADKPLPYPQVIAALADIGGQEFQAMTCTGATVHAIHVEGRGAPVMISAGQHPNETTGIVGAVRAGRYLKADGAAFTLSPLENPDGYALHQALIIDHPQHMHHAARYTALGDDLEYREMSNALFEKQIRLEAEQRSGAKLHINLHGYPSHEWTRPLSGYVPRNFEMWTLPKGFFLIFRHHADWEQHAAELADAVTKHLSLIPGLLDDIRSQIEVYDVHAGETGFQLINGFPCLIGTDQRHRVPLTLITEYPDETIYGSAFTQGHTVQMQTVLAAHAAWQTINDRIGIS